MEKPVSPKNRGTKQLFQNRVLEKLTRTHISIPVTIFIVYSLGLLYWSISHTSLSVFMSAGMFLLGLLLFTWVEYMVHRHLFHMRVYTEARAKIQYIIHGVHHEFPKDKDRLAMPPILSVTISTILLLIFKVVLGELVFSFLPGFLVGYTAYLSVHYMVHAYPPPRNFLRALWVNHSVHHYKDGEVVFGVSSPLWDYIYGTMGESKTAA